MKDINSFNNLEAQDSRNEPARAEAKSPMEALREAEGALRDAEEELRDAEADRDRVSTRLRELWRAVREAVAAGGNAVREGEALREAESTLRLDASVCTDAAAEVKRLRAKVEHLAALPDQGRP